MCVICVLHPGYTPPYEMIKHAVYNNWHGYGLILKENKKIQIIRKCDPEGENDPEEIYKLLKENEDVERILHVRHTTVGATSLENTQPFPVYWTNKRQVYFMHNGTLPTVTPTAKQLEALGEHDVTLDSSDSKKFATFKLAPMLQRIVGENGKGDIHDPFITELFDKMWSTSNRGLLVANDQENLYLGFNWTEVKDGSGGAFFASNNDYFGRVVRGPEHERRMEEQRKKNSAITVLHHKEDDSNRVSNAFQLQCPTFKMRYGVSENIKTLLEDSDVWDLDGYIAMANLSLKETEELVESLGTDLAGMLMYITSSLKEVYYGKLNVEHRLEEAGKRMGSLIKKVREDEKTIARLAAAVSGGEVHVG